MSYLFAGTGIVWLVTLGYVFWLWKKQNKIEQEIKQLENRMQG